MIGERVLEREITASEAKAIIMMKGIPGEQMEKTDPKENLLGRGRYSGGGGVGINACTGTGAGAAGPGPTFFVPVEATDLRF